MINIVEPILREMATEYCDKTICAKCKIPRRDGKCILIREGWSDEEISTMEDLIEGERKIIKRRIVRYIKDEDAQKKVVFEDYSMGCLVEERIKDKIIELENIYGCRIFATEEEIIEYRREI